MWPDLVRMRGDTLTPGWVQQRALEYLETEQQVFLAIHGWSAENASKHVRVSFKTEVRGDQYRVRQLRFRFGLEDYSAKPTRTSIARPEPTIYFDPITRYLLDEMGRPILTDEGFVITT